MAEEEEPARSSSPPLPSKGAYNIDFDALDDGFNPFASEKSLSLGSPLPQGEPAPVSWEDTPIGGGDQSHRVVAEPAETPKKKKPKSKKPPPSAVGESEGGEGVGGDAVAVAAGEGCQDVGGGGGDEKLEKLKMTENAKW